MSNAPTTSLPPRHAALLDAVGSVPLTEGDRGGSGLSTVQSMVALIGRVRRTRAQ